MRYVNLRNVKPGMILAKPIFDSAGHILLSEKSVLSESFIEKLDNIGVSGIFIEDIISKDIKIDEPISPELRSKGVAAVQKQDINECMLVSKEIVNEVVRKGAVGINMQDLRTFDNYTFEHSVSVAVLACTLGFGIGMSEKELEDLVLAGLLHDLGKLDIPEEILNKPGRLTPEEFALIKAHPNMSYDLIKDNPNISDATKQAVLLHHENHDGSGYPFNRAEKDICLGARILHVADVYDALTTRRPYKDPYSPYAAVEILQGSSGTGFDPTVVKSFLNNVPIYPKGTIIEIENSIQGVVIDNSGVHNLRPLIRLEDMSELDLSTPENYSREITMPADQDYFQIVAEEEKRKSMQTKIQKRRVLVIDSIGDTYSDLSHKMSFIYSFKHASNDKQAQNIIRESGMPDLVIVDIDNLRLTSKPEFIRMNQKISGIIPVIVIGSAGDLPTVSAYKRMGIKNYILKPYRIIYLQSEMTRYLTDWSSINKNIGEKEKS